MEFKAFILCFAFFVVTASGSAICKCTQEERKDTVSKYNVKMREGNREVDETIEIDTEKQTEKIHIPTPVQAMAIAVTQPLERSMLFTIST